jgi:hypothetical protein
MFQQGICDDLVNRIATEMLLASAGSDDGLVPIYSLTASWSMPQASARSSATLRAT